MRLHLRRLRVSPVLLVLIALTVALTFAQSSFLTVGNIGNLTLASSLIGIVTMGMLLLLVSGNFDLSVPGMVQLTSVLAAPLINHNGIAVGILASLVLGTVLGLVNGFVVTVLKVNSLIATLGSGLAFGGIALLATGSTPIPLNQLALTTFVNGKALGIPWPVYVFASVAVVTGWLLHFTVLGRQIRAVGTNVEAARYAGVRIERVRVVPFVVTGLYSAISAVLLVGSIASGDPSAAGTWSLDAIASAVVGGVSIAGGIGTVGMAVVGLLLINIIRNGFNLLNVDSNYEVVVTGIILVGAAAVDSVVRRRATRRPPTVPEGDRVSSVADPQVKYDDPLEGD